jgi:hypothetical protein
MSKPLYRHRHQLEKEAWRPIIAEGGVMCAEPVCVMKSRLIPATWAPTQLWHLSHDYRTGQTIGPSHRRCNLAEVNRRRHRHRRAIRRPAEEAEPRGRWVI